MKNVNSCCIPPFSFIGGDPQWRGVSRATRHVAFAHASYNTHRRQTLQIGPNE